MLGNGPVVFAQEEDNDEIVDVEGEDQSVVGEEEPEETSVTASKDADTTILFVEPVHNALSTLGKFLTF